MELGITYQIVVPSTLGKEIAPADLVDEVRTEVKRALATAFGGYTEIRGVGGYILESGELVEETIYQVTSWAQGPNEEVIRGLARMIKDRLQQEAVFVTMNGRAYIE